MAGLFYVSGIFISALLPAGGGQVFHAQSISATQIVQT